MLGLGVVPLEILFGAPQGLLSKALLNKDTVNHGGVEEGKEEGKKESES